MNYHKLKSRYQQFGGFRLVIEYTKLGVLGTAFKGFFSCLMKRQSFKAIYSDVLRRIEPFLIQKYGSKFHEFKTSSGQDQELKNSRIIINTDSTTVRPIWFCWLQGLENAPEIVHACYKSLQRHLVQEFNGFQDSQTRMSDEVEANVQTYEIKVIDNENWKEYVDLPEYIVEKWEKKRIPPALFSDLLRLELLIKYGGTWIDSTVLCTGLNDNHNFFNADLFLFQYSKPGRIPVSISNWFITACSNNRVLIVLREMLYAYWEDYDCTLDYYIFHLFFSMLSEEYPEEIKAMPYAQSMNSLVLLHHWGEEFDQKKWDKLTARVFFHKLAFRVSEETKRNRNNYYNYILNIEKYKN